MLYIDSGTGHISSPRSPPTSLVCLSIYHPFRQGKEGRRIWPGLPSDARRPPLVQHGCSRLVRGEGGPKAARGECWWYWKLLWDCISHFYIWRKGCIVDGCPPQIPLSEADIQFELDRRRPGQSRITTPRKETDTCKIHSGMITGTPIHVFVPNTDQRGGDYSEMPKAYRPSHADATYDFKYGVRSVQGGGRSSARETIGRVAAGAIAKKILKLKSGTEILAYVSQVHKVVLPEGLVDDEALTMEHVCMFVQSSEGILLVVFSHVSQGMFQRGLGSPVFDKLEVEFAKVCLSLPATKGFEVGSGFSGTVLTGSEHNDEFYIDKHGKIRTRTNRSGWNIEW